MRQLSKYRLKNSGYTLIEIIVVVLISAVIATLALQQFQKTIETNRYKTVQMNLIAIHSAYTMQAVRKGKFTPPLTWHLAEINSNLGLNIPEDSNVTYEWLAGTYVVTAYVNASTPIMEDL